MRLARTSGHHAYDGAGETTGETDWNDATTSFAYDHDGNLVTTTYPSGDKATSTFDANDEMLTSTLDTSSSSLLAEVSYRSELDPNGSIGSETDSGDLGKSETYSLR